MTALGTQLEQLEALLRRAGTFRSVSRWSLVPGAKMLIRDSSGAEHHPGSLADPSGRRLILLVTDAVADHWYEDAIWRVLRLWAGLMPTAIIYALPERYRPHTALSSLPIAMRPRRPGAPNHAADTEVRWWDADPPAAVGTVPVPVVALRPRALASWARAVAAGATWVDAVWARPPRSSPRPANARLSGEDRVRAFQARASVGAQALARVLAGAPVLSWPLIGVLQTSLLPETGSSELAEVLAGGLLERATPASTTGSEQFRFRPTVGELLRRGTTATQEWGTLNAVRVYLEQKAESRSATPARSTRPQETAELEPFRVLRSSMAGRLGLSPAHAPLMQTYELVVLRPAQSGRLAFETFRLFQPGAEPGHQQRFRIRCETSDEHGTVFAVVATEAAEADAKGQEFELVSVQSANLDPGVYEPTAVLVRPGRVDFRGLPAELRPESRRWSELVATVPERLDRHPPVHLICVIEVSGTGHQLVNRADRVRQLIEQADRADGLLTVSVISYGPHSFDDEMPDEPTQVLTWAATSRTSLSALAQLASRSPLTGDYPRAAQLECALTEVAARLPGRDGRPVLVVAGSRPPFPPRADVRTLIIPCPDSNDWRRALQRLRDVPGIAFGAIADPGADRPIWIELGADAFAWADLFNPRRFASDLGLRRYAQNLPFPLVDAGGG